MTDHIQTYIERVESLFPALGKEERAFLKNLRSDVTDCFQGTHPFSYEAVVEKFGEPQEVYHRFLESVGGDYLLTQIRRARRWRRGVIGAVLMVVLALFTAVCLIGQGQRDFRSWLNDLGGYDVVVMGEGEPSEDVFVEDGA